MLGSGKWVAAVLLSIIAMAMPAVCRASAPEWFTERSIEGLDGEMVGYGMAESLDGARARAASEIAQSISATVRAEVTVGTRKIGKEKQSQGAYVLNTMNATAQVRDARVLKVEEVDHSFYVAVAISMASPERRLYLKAKGAGRELCNKVSDVPDLYKGSPFQAALDSLAGCHVPVRLERVDGRWTVWASEQWVTLGQRDIPRLFGSYGSEALSVKGPTKPVVPGSGYKVELTSSSQQPTSVFIVSESGTVQALVVDKELHQGSSAVLPEDPTESIEAVNARGGMATKDWFIAATCSGKASTTGAGKLTQALEMRSEYTLDRLATDLAAGRCATAATIVMVDGRSR